jgi:hypothetical protein
MTHLLALAGIRIDGARPWDIQVHHRHFLAESSLPGRSVSVSLSESHIDGW